MDASEKVIHDALRRLVPKTADYYRLQGIIGAYRRALERKDKQSSVIAHQCEMILRKVDMTGSVPQELIV